MPELGAFMVTATRGWFAWAIRRVTHSHVNHAAVYIGGGLVVEAQADGAVYGRLSKYPDAIWSTLPLSLIQRKAVALAAINLLGTPYNFLDIAAQALVRIFHWHAPDWALQRLGNARRLQCAQLVDVAYERAGIRLFKDGRPEGLVAPSDLYDLIREHSAEREAA